MAGGLRTAAGMRCVTACRWRAGFSERMADMDKCTETAGWWPNSLADVSPEEIDGFIAHAEVCAYHGAKLEAEDEEFQHAFRLARLFGRGRVLEGEELGRAAAAVRRQLEHWGEDALGRKARLKRVSVYNGHRPVAKWSYHSPHRRQVIELKLDPEAGLEIRGVAAGDGFVVKARRAAYLLAGVLHTGEKFFQLGYGYTVGLKVEELDEETFRIEFRCVEDEALAKELAERGETRLSSVLRRLRGCLSAVPPLVVHLPPAVAAVLFTLGATLGATLLAMTLGPRSKSSVHANVRLAQPSGGHRRGQRAALKSVPADGATPLHSAKPPALPPDESDPTPLAKQLQEASRLSPLATGRDGSDVAAEEASVKEKILSYSQKGALPPAPAGQARRAAAGIRVRARRVWHPDRAVLWALKTRSAAGMSIVMFEFGQNRELREKLSKRIEAFGGKVLAADPNLSVRDLPKIEVVLTREATGVGLLFKTELGHTPYKWGPYSGTEGGVAGASALDDALNMASVEAFPKIKELLTQHGAHDAGGATGGGGANADPRVPLDVQTRTNRSHYRDATGGPGDDIIRRPRHPYGAEGA